MDTREAVAKVRRFAYQDSPDTMGMAVDADDFDAILAIFAEERVSIVKTLCEKIGELKERAEQAEAREAKLVELLGRVHEYMVGVATDYRFYNDDTEPLIDEICAALATVKEGNS